MSTSRAFAHQPSTGLFVEIELMFNVANITEVGLLSSLSNAPVRAVDVVVVVLVAVVRAWTFSLFALNALRWGDPAA